MTAQNDNARSAANLNETTLNTSNVNVNQFGRLFSRSLDGNSAGEPLYVPNVAIPGQGTHNVVYVATFHNSVFAFDADDPSQAAPFWQVNLGPSQPCPCSTTFLMPEYGIVGTPVIDPTTSTLYVVARTLENGVYFHRLHALDITTGQEKFGGPVAIQPSVPGNGYDNQGGFVVFNSQRELQRAGLLLANGTVYVAFGSMDETNPWHGWVIGYNALNIQQQVSVYNTSPNGRQSGVWQSGRGLVSDANGYLYFLSGNGDYDGANDFGDSMIKLSARGPIVDWFTPDNQATLDSSDTDVGSGGPILIPKTNLLIGGGKQGILYLVDSSNMGHLKAGNGQIVQSFQATPGEIHHTAYWDRSGAPLLFLWGAGDVLKAFQFGNGVFNTTPVGQNALSSQWPGGVLAVSANGSTAGTGILWATTASSPTQYSIESGTLRAFDASNVSNQLWNSDQNPSRDSLGNFAKFVSSTIADGKVYVPTFSNQLAVYGLLGSPTGVGIWVGPKSVTLAASGQQQQFTATVAGTSNTAVTWSMSPSVGTLTSNGLYTAPVPGSISSSQTITITATSVADPTKSAAATVTLTPVTATGTATFVAMDTTTQGNWKGGYGSNGYNVIGDTTSYPAYVTVTPSGTNTAIWVSSTSDVRALLKAASSTDRIAATWYNPTSLLIDIVFNDGLQHQLAIYCLDWDTTTRTETINLLDANGVLLNTQSVSNFHNGQYLVWELSGHVQIRVTNTALSTNGVIAGLFFDTTGPASSFTVTGPAGGALNTASNNFTVKPNGTYNGTITITPSGGGLSTPITLTLNNFAPSQTFTITPTSVGPVTLTPSNNGSLTNPAAVTYATPPSAPAIGTATGGNGQATVAYTAPASTGGSPFTSYTAACVPQGAELYNPPHDSGAASPITVTGLTNGTTYICTVTATNAAGDSVPSAASNSVTPNGPVTSFTLTGPTGGTLNTASTNFTVTPNGTYNGTITITPSGGGVSAPVTLTFNSSAAPQTFTITPTSVGPVTLTPSNNGSLSNPAAVMYATPPSAPTIGTATAGSGQATVTFTAPASTGGSAITSYTATCGNQSASGAASPIVVTGLTNGTAYTCTVTATNAVGVGAPSAASNSVTPAVGIPTGTAAFVTLDTTTQGNWKGVYGADGYNVINNSVSSPSYVTVTPSGTNAYTWASSTTDVRALLKSASSTDRIAATWYNNAPFVIDLLFNDTVQHQVAVYCLDWDSTTRAETIAILNANGVVLNTQQMSNFHSGEYLVWELSGHVQIRVTATAVANGVISGLFFDTTAPASSFTLTGPTGGPLNTASTNFTVTPNGTYTGTITITPSGGGVSGAITLTFNNSAASQTFTITPTALGPVTLTPSNSGSLINPPALSYATPPSAATIGTATAGNGQATISFTAPGSTGGSPITSYTATCGSQSVSGAGSPIAVTGLTNGIAYTCTVTATNAAGISAPSAASNSVTPFVAASSFTFTGPIGGALNTASSNFTMTPNGTYSGTITITPSGGGVSGAITLTFNNSAASQTFTITPTTLGPVTLTPSNSGSLTNPAALTYATPAGAPTIGTATAGNGQATVSFTAPGSTGGSPITSYTATCGSQSVSGAGSPIAVTGLTNGTAYTCTVTATNAAGISTPSAASNSVTPFVPTTTGTATFLSLDSVTQGNWISVYGADGYNIVNSAVSYPGYVTVTLTGVAPYTWASSTTDVRALSKAPPATGRIASTWYNSSSLVIDLVFKDGAQHQVAFYCLDWDSTSRSEMVQILDGNGVVLNTQSMPGFHNGEYLVWQLSGHVRIQVTNRNSSSNAVVSGLFFR